MQPITIQFAVRVFYVRTIRIYVEKMILYKLICQMAAPNCPLRVYPDVWGRTAPICGIYFLFFRKWTVKLVLK